MNTEIYIAKRMLKREEKSSKFSKPIVVLAIFGITLGSCVIILSISITSGFQNEIRDKVVGFGSHIQIESQYSNISFESSPMMANQPFIEKIKQIIKKIKKINAILLNEIFRLDLSNWYENSFS